MICPERRAEGAISIAPCLYRSTDYHGIVVLWSVCVAARAGAAVATSGGCEGTGCFVCFHNLTRLLL